MFIQAARCPIVHAHTAAAAHARNKLQQQQRALEHTRNDGINARHDIQNSEFTGQRRRCAHCHIQGTAKWVIKIVTAEQLRTQEDDGIRARYTQPQTRTRRPQKQRAAHLHMRTSTAGHATPAARLARMHENDGMQARARATQPQPRTHRAPPKTVFRSFACGV